MPNTAVIGLQWGDESKGKLVDILSENHKVVVRYQGGANAGHTVVFKGEEYKLHLIPSGIFRAELSIIAHDVAFDPITFLGEVNGLLKRGVKIDSENLAISDIAPLDLFYHRRLDEVNGGKIGTTARGIGPTYADQTARIGLRVCDFFDVCKLEEKVRENSDYVNYLIKYKDSSKVLLDEEISKEIEELKKAREKVLPFVNPDIESLILAHDRSLLFEGAQGTLLDNVLGTYPNVTSSRTVRGEVYNGAGVYVNLDKVIGVFKAYTTRVGGGPFPTEQNNEIGERLRRRGGEYGTTTGRARRCGWPDFFALKYSVRINQINEISLAKLDVLDQESQIQICTGYLLNGEKISYFPRTELENAIPIYESVPGWMQDTTNIRKLKDLPENARRYIKKIEDYAQVPVTSIGVGKDREQIINKGD